MAKEFLTGNEAFAHAALEAGVRVCAGYPGTPSSEVIETVAKEHAAGRAEGEKEKQRQIALRMKGKGMSAEDIAELTGLSVAEVGEL